MTVPGHMSCQGSAPGPWIVGGGGNSKGRRPNQVQDVQLSLLCKNSLVRRSLGNVADACGAHASCCPTSERDTGPRPNVKWCPKLIFTCVFTCFLKMTPKQTCFYIVFYMFFENDHKTNLFLHCCLHRFYYVSQNVEKTPAAANEVLLLK